MRRFAVFNPEHDLALSNGDKHFIAPRNIREMGHDLAPLMEFVEGDDILVWGWDHAIKEQLLRRGVAADRLPTDAALTALRECSGRATAHRLLKAFRSTHPEGPYIGESILAHALGDIAAYATLHGHIILKDPLSSSGKGLRHVNFNENINRNSVQLGRQATLLYEAKASVVATDAPSASVSTSPLEKVENWTNALIRRHGYLTAEPYYDKVQDFAMEFCIREGQCRFIGYSLFNTNPHGRYESNLLMEDEKIEALLAQHIPNSALHEVRDWVIAHSHHIIPFEWDTTRHPLYFGIDMMVVNSQSSTLKRSSLAEGKSNPQLSTLNSQLKLHPCVEINLRLNMGIIAHEVRRKLLPPGVEGRFHVAAFPSEEAAQQFHREHTEKYPPVYWEGKMVSGYHPLTPILSHTHHHAYVICG